MFKQQDLEIFRLKLNKIPGSETQLQVSENVNKIA